MKKNILQVVSGMDRGGVETFLMNILRTINNEEYHFIFLCYGEKKYDYEDEVLQLGGKIVRIGSPKKAGILRYLSEVRRIIEQEDIHVVHVHTFYNASLALFAARLSRVGVRIAHSHSTMTELNSNLVRKTYFFIATKLINLLTTNRIACSDAAGMALFRKKNFEVINNGIILSNFEFSAKRRSVLRVGLGVFGDEPVLVHVGRFTEAKNHVFLIEVFNSYLKINPEAKLLLIGDGELRPVIEAKVKTLHIEENVIFAGKRSDVAELYSTADLFILTSHFEGLGIVLIEAQANGLPCLSSNAVPREANVSNLVVFKSLKDSDNSWGAAAEGLIGSRIGNGVELVKASGYDITDTVTDIKVLYDRLSS